MKIVNLCILTYWSLSAHSSFKDCMRNECQRQLIEINIIGEIFALRLLASLHPSSRIRTRTESAKHSDVNYGACVWHIWCPKVMQMRPPLTHSLTLSFSFSRSWCKRQIVSCRSHYNRARQPSVAFYRARGVNAAAVRECVLLLHGRQMKKGRKRHSSRSHFGFVTRSTCTPRQMENWRASPRAAEKEEKSASRKNIFWCCSQVFARALQMSISPSDVGSSEKCFRD